MTETANARIPEGMETTAEQHKAWAGEDVEFMEIDDVQALLRDHERALAEIARLKTAVLEWGDAAHRQAAAWQPLADAVRESTAREQRARGEERERMIKLGLSFISDQQAREDFLQLARSTPMTTAESGIVADSDRIAFAQAAALRSPADGWRAIESAPKDGTDILLFHPYGGGVQIVASYAVSTSEAMPDHCWHTLDGPSYHKDFPSMWQPLPSPPAEESK